MKNLRKIVALTLCCMCLVMALSPALAEGGANSPSDKREVLRNAISGLTGIQIQKNGQNIMMHAKWGGQQTEEEKAAIEAAKEAQKQAYIQFLDKLVVGGIMDPVELEAYNRVQSRQALANAFSVSQWTVAKAQELQKALMLSGEEQTAALASLMTEGLLTQEESDALLSSSRRGLSIDYSDWTIAQVREFRTLSGKTSQERVALITDLVSKGLLNPLQADTLLASYVESLKVSKSGMSDEQKAAWDNAYSELKEAYKAIAETLVKK